MKKFISIILSAAFISASVPAFADYTEVSYDVEQFNYTYDDGTATNDIDGTNALAATDTTVAAEASDSSVFTKEFFMTFDFRFDSAEDGSVPGSITIEKKKSNGDMDKLGPSLSYSDGVLRTATGSTSFQTLAEISPDTWYTMELEGKMVVAGAAVVCRVYGYVSGEKTLIQETPAINLRQFYAGSSNGNPNCIKGTNVSLDNIKFISEYPDEIVISATEDATELDAGTTLAFDYVAKRLGTEVTKHAVTWTLCNENDEEITDGSVTITADGVLKADIASPTQDVTVKATTTVGAEPLTGTYNVIVNAVNTENEKFDTIVLSAADEMKAGESTAFSYTASKAGEDVTDTVTNEDIVWSIYDCDDLSPNNNKNISITDGVLTVDDSVIAQSIYVRATSTSGTVYGSRAIKINFSDNQKEAVLGYDACETSIETAEKAESVDGSAAYLTTSAVTVGIGNQTDYTLSSFDVKFSANYAGVRIKRNDGKENSSFVYRDGTISQQTGSSSYSVIASDISTEKWYHMEIMYRLDDASCNIYEYNADGTKTLIKTAIGLNRRNGSQMGKLEIQSGTYIDNIKLVTPIADNVELKAPSQYIFAGDTAQYSVTASRSRLSLNDYADIEWSVLDGENLPILDENISVSDTGLLTVTAMASPQTVTVVAKASNGASDSAQMTIQTTEVFEITNLGINEAGTKIVKLYVEKKFTYDDDVTFIVAIKDADGVLKGVKLVKSFGDRFTVGENEVTVDFDIPQGFNPETDVIETMVWTAV